MCTVSTVSKRDLCELAILEKSLIPNTFESILVTKLREIPIKNGKSLFQRPQITGLQVLLGVYGEVELNVKIILAQDI